MTEVSSQLRHPSPITTHSETTFRPSQESSLPSPWNPNSPHNQNHSHANLDDKEAGSPISAMGDFEKNDFGFENGTSQLPISTGSGTESILTDSYKESDKTEDLEKQAVHNDRNQDESKEKDPNLVEWNEPSDPENPMNWSRGRKWLITLAMGSMTWIITFASSVFSTATIVTAREFHTSEEVMILGTSLFVLVRLGIP